MSKKWWFLLLLIFVIIPMALLAFAAYDSGFKQTLATGLTGVFGPMWTAVVTYWCNFASYIGNSGVNFAIFSLGTIVFGMIVLFSLQHLGRKHPNTPIVSKFNTNQNTPLSAGNMNFQNAPTSPERSPTQKTEEPPQQSSS